MNLIIKLLQKKKIINKPYHKYENKKISSSILRKELRNTPFCLKLSWRFE